MSDVAAEVVVILQLRTVPEFLADTRPFSGHEHGVGRLESFRRSTFLGWTSSVFAGDLTRARCALDGLAASDSLEHLKHKIGIHVFTIGFCDHSPSEGSRSLKPARLLKQESGYSDQVVFKARVWI